MRNRGPAAVAVLLALVATIAVARAEPRTFWDPAQQQWLVADSDSTVFKRYSRNRIPREMVLYRGSAGPGTIVVNTAERRLYYVYAPGKAIKYAIGVGREGFEWSGSDVITQRVEWPTWKPPAEMIAREKKKGHVLKEVMPGGLDNPLGARALYIGYTLYRIHGTTDPASVGHAVSSGCIRLTNEDIVDLYDRVRLGTRVVVLSKSPGNLSAPPAVEPTPAVVATVEPGNSLLAVPKPRLNAAAPKTGDIDFGPRVPVKPVVTIKPAAKVATIEKKVVSDPAPAMVKKKKKKIPPVAPTESVSKDDLTPDAPLVATVPDKSVTSADLLAGVARPEEAAASFAPATASP